MNFERPPQKDAKKDNKSESFYGIEKTILGFKCDIGVGSKEKDIELKGNFDRKELTARATPEMVVFLAKQGWGWLNKKENQQPGSTKNEYETGALDSGKKISDTLLELDIDTRLKVARWLNSATPQEKSNILKYMGNLDAAKIVEISQLSTKEACDLVTAFEAPRIEKPRRISPLEGFLSPFRERMEKYIAEDQVEKAQADVRNFAKQSSAAETGAEKSPSQTSRSEEELAKDIMNMIKKL